MPDGVPIDGRAPRPDAADGQVTSGRWRSADVVRLGSVDSTNRYARDAVLAGRPGGFVVVADHQDAGRGRRGRRWDAPHGGALLCSLVFRPRAPRSATPLLGFAVALAVADAIAATTGTEAGVKWPNDVLVGGRKVAGLLSEVVDADPDAVVVGSGVNLAFPSGWLDGATGDDGRPLAERATTIELATGRAVEREQFLAAFLDELDRYAPVDVDDRCLVAAVVELRRRCVTLGQEVEVVTDLDVRRGTAVAVADDGRLEVSFASGSELVGAADVVHLREKRGPGRQVR